MNLFRQIGAVTAMNFKSLPHRIGTSIVIVIGIAGVVAVLVSVLAMSTGMLQTMETRVATIAPSCCATARRPKWAARSAATVRGWSKTPPASSATAPASRSQRRKRCAW